MHKEIKYFRIKLLNINHQIKVIRITKTNIIIKRIHLILKTIIKKNKIVKIVKILKIVILFIRN